MEMYKISGWTEYELGESMMIAGFVLLTVFLLWELDKAKVLREFYFERGEAIKLELDEAIGTKNHYMRWYDKKDVKIKALQGQIAHLTEQAIIHEKAKKSAAGKKGIETIKRRGKKK